jgi:hypothetical protein
MRRFYFTADRVLSREEAALLESIGPEIIEQYNTLVESIRPFGLSDIQWWSSYLASRVTTEDSPLDFIGLFFLFEKNIKSYSEVVIAYPWQNALVMQACQRNDHFLKITLEKTKTRPALALRKLISFLLILGYNFISCFALRFKPDRYRKPVTLIKLYAIDSSYKKNKFEDRYFPGLFEYVRKNTTCFPAYFPTISSNSVRLSWRIQKKMLQDKENTFFFAEEFLQLSGIWKIISHFLNPTYPAFPNAVIKDYDFNGLFSDYWKFSAFSHHRFLSIVAYYSIEGMQKRKIEISRIFCWNEGQPLDKIIMLALNKYYPNVKKMGYQGFIESNYFLAGYPTGYEKKSGVLPDVIGVCSTYLVAGSKRFLGEMSVICAPGFRLIYRVQTRKSNKFQILFLLSNNLNEMIEYLTLFDQVKNHFFGFDIEWRIRPHPARPIKSEKYELFLSEEDALAIELSKSNIVVAGCGSSGIEALLAGCYTAVLQSKRFFTRSSLASVNYFSGKYQIIYDQNDLIKLVMDYRNKKLEMSRVCDDFIVPVNQETVASFYNYV